MNPFTQRLPPHGPARARPAPPQRAAHAQPGPPGTPSPHPPLEGVPQGQPHSPPLLSSHTLAPLYPFPYPPGPASFLGRERRKEPPLPPAATTLAPLWDHVRAAPGRSRRHVG